MKFYGNAQLQQNFLSEAVIPLDTSFPISPKVGQIVFKDKTLYICLSIDNSLPVWCPLTREITTYAHIQSTSASTWVVTHNLKTPHVSVTVYDEMNRVVMPNEIIINDGNSLAVAMGTPSQGKVVVVSGHFEGQEKPTYAYEHYQTVPATSWVINHGLGTYPLIRVFVGNQEVQPESISHDTVNTTTITFTSAQVGQAKCI